MSSINLKSFDWHGSEEELRNLIESGKLIDKSEWNTVINKKLEIEMYNAKKFLMKGHEYIEKPTADMIQSAQKFWLAAAWTLKRFYLKLGLNITSHPAMTFFVKFALNCDGSLPQDVPELFILDNCWKTAGKFHRIEYDGKKYTIDEFRKKIPEVEYFVNKFPELNVNVIRPQLLHLLEKECQTSSENITIKEKAENLKFGEEHFNCLYEAY